MAQSWESQEIQDLGKQYAKLAAAGAPSDVLNNIHNQAEALRAKAGYSGGADGSQVTTISRSSSRSGSSTAATSTASKVTVIGSEADFNASSYDFVPVSLSTTTSGSSLDGGTIAGYVITALVLVVILDKLIG